MAFSTLRAHENLRPGLRDLRTAVRRGDSFRGDGDFVRNPSCNSAQQREAMEMAMEGWVIESLM